MIKKRVLNLRDGTARKGKISKNYVLYVNEDEVTTLLLPHLQVKVQQNPLILYLLLF